MNEIATILSDLDAMGVHYRQHREEFAAAWALVKAHVPHTLLEIGSLGGGSLYGYGLACAPGSRIVSVDLARSEDFAAMLRRSVGALTERGYRVETITESSLDTRTAVRVCDSLVSVDVLHLDGDHRYDSVRADFLTYGRLVSSGLVILHDVDPERGAPGVAQLWREIRGSGRAHEFCLGGDGIGVLEV